MQLSSFARHIEAATEEGLLLGQERSAEGGAVAGYGSERDVGRQRPRNGTDREARRKKTENSWSDA